MKHKPMSAVKFRDGIVGASLEITFPATEEVTLWQKHAFRVDEAAVTQLVLTGDDRLDPADKEELATWLAHFVPDPDTDPAS